MSIDVKFESNWLYGYWLIKCKRKSCWLYGYWRCDWIGCCRSQLPVWLINCCSCIKVRVNHSMSVDCIGDFCIIIIYYIVFDRIHVSLCVKSLAQLKLEMRLTRFLNYYYCCSCCYCCCHWRCYFYHHKRDRKSVPHPAPPVDRTQDLRVWLYIEVVSRRRRKCLFATMVMTASPTSYILPHTTCEVS